MKHEKWVLEEKLGEAAGCKVPQAAIAQMKAARVCAEEILNDAKRVGAFSDVRALMKSKGALLLAFDRTFLLELEWLGQHGEVCVCASSAQADPELLPDTLGQHHLESGDPEARWAPGR